jgi:hypothetical protein
MEAFVAGLVVIAADSRAHYQTQHWVDHSGKKWWIWMYYSRCELQGQSFVEFWKTEKGLY